MAEPIEYRRIRQKVDTLENWNNNPLILGDGEQAFVRGGGVVLNFRMGDGTKRFSELPNVIQYDQAAYVAAVGNTLPVPQNGVGYSILGEGSYNGGSIVVPAGNLGIASYSGNWTVRNMELPAPIPSGSVQIGNQEPISGDTTFRKFFVDAITGLSSTSGTTESVQSSVYKFSTEHINYGNNRYLNTINFQSPNAGFITFCVLELVMNDRVKEVKELGMFPIVSGLNTLPINTLILPNQVVAIKDAGSSSTRFYYGARQGATLRQFSKTTGYLAGSIPNTAYYYSLHYIDERKINLSRGDQYFNQSVVGTDQFTATFSPGNIPQQRYFLSKRNIFATRKIVESIKLQLGVSGNVVIAKGVIDQHGKFIESETRTIPSDTTGGKNFFFNDLFLNPGETLAIKTPTTGLALQQVSDNSGDLWNTVSYYNEVLVQDRSANLTMQLIVSDVDESVFATKSNVQILEDKVASLENSISSLFGVPIFNNVLHLGNSLTIHPITSYWWGSWGMAASEKSKDYVNVLNEMLKVNNPSIQSTPYSLAEWEVNYNTYDLNQLNGLLSGRDLIVVRIGENASFSNTFKQAYSDLITHIQSINSSAKIVIGGLWFFNQDKENAMRQVASEKGLTFFSIENLYTPENSSFIGAVVKGDDGQNHTVNNQGVAIHPGDKGMSEIAKVIYRSIRPLNT